MDEKTNVEELEKQPNENGIGDTQEIKTAGTKSDNKKIKKLEPLYKKELFVKTIIRIVIYIVIIAVIIFAVLFLISKVALYDSIGSMLQDMWRDIQMIHERLTANHR